MRKLFFLLAVMGAAQVATAQPFGGLSATANSQTIYMGNLLGKQVTLVERNDLEGSPYFTEQFKSATVIMRNGFKAEKVPIKFNIYSNEIIFKKDEKEMALDSVKYVVYYDNPADSSSVKVFASGYPSAGVRYTDHTVYQLLGGGTKYHFLKFYFQKIEPKRTMGMHHLKEFVTYNEYYVYSAESGLQKVVLNSGSIAKALPAMEEKIKELSSAKKLNLKKESDIAILFNELDKLK